ncbi:MAG: AAA family ATPase, partial [Desulfamplus sp.]|nr:AAA family ATPase [Desulfamplus sp.]
MIKFPYGMFDFKSIITDGCFYCDRTSKIPLLENAKSQLFIRPRRFGKSLLLSMLENYYDV